jgi:hypothetical protein
MCYELKAVAVKGVFILISSNVVDDDTVGRVRALKRVWFTKLQSQNENSITLNRDSPNVKRSRQTSVTGILVIVQLSSDVVLRELILLSKRFHDLVNGIAWSVLNSSSSHD